MKGSEGLLQNPAVSEKPTSIQWTEVVPTVGRRTAELFEQTPQIERLQSIKILEHIEPNTDTGIVLFPGGLDHITDNETLNLGHELGFSTFHIKYSSDSSFSIRREVAQTLDHTEERGIKKYHIVAGSWGGIPAFSSIYRLIQEGTTVSSLFTVAAAFQPSDLATMVREIGGRLAAPILAIKKPFPGRQTMARISRGVADFRYDDPDVLKKIAEIPTVILIPPDGNDWWVDARESHEKFFPNAYVIEYPAYSSLFEKMKTLGGHDSGNAIGGIKEIEKAVLSTPQSNLPIPKGFRQIR